MEPSVVVVRLGEKGREEQSIERNKRGRYESGGNQTFYL